MILTLEQKFEVELPAGWRELPPAPVLSVGSWIFEWVEEVCVLPARKENLIRALGETADFVLDNLVENRSWVAILDTEDTGRVRGLASIVAIARDEASDDIATPASPVIGTIMWHSQVSGTTISGVPAILLHDIGIYDSLIGTELAERFVGTMFADDVIVQLEILAEDISYFDDIVAAGTDVLAGLRFVEGA